MKASQARYKLRFYGSKQGTVSWTRSVKRLYLDYF